MYQLKIPKEQMTSLWRLREYAACGPIVKQVRQAISDYLKSQEERIGCPIKEVEEVMEKHKRESKN